MLCAREDGTASTVLGCRPARIGALASVLVLTAIALAGCVTHDATGSEGSTEIEGGVGLSGPGDGAAPLLQVSIDGGTTDEGGTTDHAAAIVDSGKGHEICGQSWHEICGQSWSVLTDPNAPPGFSRGGTRMLALDGVGNMYVAASFSGTVNVAGKTLQSSGSGAENLLVVKVDPACRVLWAKTFGAPQAAVQLGGVAADAAGNVVVAGTLTGPPVDFGSGPVGALPDSRPSALVFKLGPDGQGLWSHAYLASAGSFLIQGYDVGVVDVAVDSRGNTVFVAAMGCPARASCNPGSVDFGGGPVTFTWSLVELDANGQFVFDANASFPGADVYFDPYSLTTGSAGRIWAAGYGDEFDIVAFDADGHQQGVQKVSGTGYASEGQPTVRVDANDEAFAVAPSAAQLVDGGGTLDDTLLYKFSASGSPSWTAPAIPKSTANASWADWPGGRLAVDPSGRALVSSVFAGSADFGSVGSLTSAGGLDSAILRFDAQGHLIGGERWGGAEDDYPVDVAVDAAGDAIIVGLSVPPIALDAGLSISQGSESYAVFVAKLGW